jgi:hypothetical protein
MALMRMTSYTVSRTTKKNPFAGR